MNNRKLSYSSVGILLMAGALFNGTSYGNEELQINSTPTIIIQNIPSSITSFRYEYLPSYGSDRTELTDSMLANVSDIAIFQSFVKRFAESQTGIDPSIVAVIRDNFWEML